MNGTRLNVRSTLLRCETLHALQAIVKPTVYDGERGKQNVENVVKSRRSEWGGKKLSGFRESAKNGSDRGLELSLIHI